MSNDVYGTLRSAEGFYIGDICYVLGDAVYDDIWGKEHDYEDGLYDDLFGKGEKYGFAVCGTGIGDGVYHDSDCHSYPVDAGVIGAVPMELIREYGRKDMDLFDEEGRPCFGRIRELGRYVEGQELIFNAEYADEGTSYDIRVYMDGKFFEAVFIECAEPEEDEEDYDGYYDEDEDE